MKKLIQLFLVISFIAINFSIYGASITSTQPGNWSAPATWAAITRTGTISYTNGSTAVTGTGTSFTTELSVGSIIITNSPGAITRTVASITDNTHLTLTTTANSSQSNKSFTAQVVPGIGDAVIIANGDNITVNTSAVCASLTLSSGSSATTLTISGSNSLIASGAVTINGGTGNNDDKIIAVGSGSFSCASITMVDPGNDNRSCQVTISTGTVTVSGNITMNGSNARNQITFTNSGTLNEGGSITGGDLITVTGSTVNYNGAAAQIVRATTYYNLTLSGSGAKTTTGDTVNGKLSMQGTATTTGTIATYNSATTLEYKGSGAQITGTEFPATLSGTGGLIIDNANGVTLNFSKKINFNLTMSSGLLFLGANTLTVDGNISNVSPDVTRMIVLDDGVNLGTLKVKVPNNQIYRFYVGDTRSGANFTPAIVTFSAGTSSTSYLALTMIAQKDVNNNSITDFLNRSWTFTPTNLSSPQYTIELDYVSGDVNGTESNIWFGKYSGSTWTLLDQPNTSNHKFTSSTTLTSFSTFTGGEQGLLPVELSSFSSSVNANNVKLTWITASESNNQGFEIYRKSEQTNWIKIGFVSGSGTVNTPKTYTYNDNGLSGGKYSYQLKQIDFNGNFEFFVMSGITEIGTPKKFEVSQNYPNPFNPVTKIDYQLPDAGKIKLVIYDMLGREVKNLVNEVKPAGFYSAEFDATSLASGIYIYRLSFESSNNNFIITKRMSLIK